MGETTPSSEEHRPEQHIRSVEDEASLSRTNEQGSAETKTSAKAETTDSNSKVATLVCSPGLTEDQFLSWTDGAKAIIVVAYATGTMPDRLVPAIQRRIQEGIPVFVLSDNPGDQHGIVKIMYAAGKGAYDAGAVPLEKVNVNQQAEVFVAITEALNRGLSGQALADAIRDRYAYHQGETKPIAEWDDPAYIPPHSRTRVTRVSGLTGQNDNDSSPK